jgi:hypothetical protein
MPCERLAVGSFETIWEPGMLSLEDGTSPERFNNDVDAVEELEG